MSKPEQLPPLSPVQRVQVALDVVRALSKIGRPEYHMLATESRLQTELRALREESQQ